MIVRAEPKASLLIKQLVLEFPGSDRSLRAKPDVGMGKGVGHAASAPAESPIIRDLSSRSVDSWGYSMARKRMKRY